MPFLLGWWLCGAVFAGVVVVWCCFGVFVVARWRAVLWITPPLTMRIYQAGLCITDALMCSPAAALASVSRLQVWYLSHASVPTRAGEEAQRRHGSHI